VRGRCTPYHCFANENFELINHSHNNSSLPTPKICLPGYNSNIINQSTWPYCYFRRVAGAPCSSAAVVSGVSGTGWRDSAAPRPGCPTPAPGKGDLNNLKWCTWNLLKYDIIYRFYTAQRFLCKVQFKQTIFIKQSLVFLSEINFTKVQIQTKTTLRIYSIFLSKKRPYNPFYIKYRFYIQHKLLKSTSP